MTISVVVGTFGDPIWQERAQAAVRSAETQTTLPQQVVQVHAETLHEARNQGAASTESEWLCFLDADDLLDSRYIESMEEAVSGLLSPALVQPSTMFVRNGVPEEPSLIPSKGSILTSNWMVIGTLVSRSTFDAVGGFADWPIYEDWDLWIRCVLHGDALVRAPKAIYIVNETIPSRNNQSPSFQRQVYDEIKSQYVAL